MADIVRTQELVAQADAAIGQSPVVMMPLWQVLDAVDVRYRLKLNVFEPIELHRLMPLFLSAGLVSILGLVTSLTWLFVAAVLFAMAAGPYMVSHVQYQQALRSIRDTALPAPGYVGYRWFTTVTGDCQFVASLNWIGSGHDTDSMSSLLPVQTIVQQSFGTESGCAAYIEATTALLPADAVWSQSSHHRQLQPFIDHHYRSISDNDAIHRLNQLGQPTDGTTSRQLPPSSDIWA